MTQPQPPAEVSPSKPELSILHDVAKALTSSLNLDSILQTIMEKVAAYFRPDTWSLLMTDDEHHELYFAIAVGDASASLKIRPPPHRRRHRRMGRPARRAPPRPRRLQGRALRLPHRRDDPLEDPLHPLRPARLQEPILGVIQLINVEIRRLRQRSAHAPAGHGRLRRHRHRQRPRRRKDPGTHHHRRLHRPLQRAPPL